MARRAAGLSVLMNSPTKACGKNVKIPVSNNPPTAPVIKAIRSASVTLVWYPNPKLKLMIGWADCATAFPAM